MVGGSYRFSVEGGQIAGGRQSAPQPRKRRSVVDCRHAFTLVELLVVVSIIAILAAIAIPNLLEAQTRSKVSAAKNSLRVLEVALEAYRVDNHAYPYTESYRFNLWVPPGGRPRMNQEALCGGLTSPVAYITSLPEDPFKQRGMQLSARDIQPINPCGPGLDGEFCYCPDGDDKEMHLYVDAQVAPPLIEETAVNYERHGWGFLDDYESSRIVVMEVMSDLPDMCTCAEDPEHRFFWMQDQMTWSMGGQAEGYTCQGHAEYVLFSLGPDRQYSAPDREGNALRSRYDIYNRYDPTNGSVSAGNIVRYHGGLMYPN